MEVGGEKGANLPSVEAVVREGEIFSVIFSEKSGLFRIFSDSACIFAVQ